MAGQESEPDKNAPVPIVLEMPCQFVTRRILQMGAGQNDQYCGGQHHNTLTLSGGPAEKVSPSAMTADARVHARGCKLSNIVHLVNQTLALKPAPCNQRSALGPTAFPKGIWAWVTWATRSKLEAAKLQCLARSLQLLYASLRSQHPTPLCDAAKAGRQAAQRHHS